jgi:hypothetical protein
MKRVSPSQVKETCVNIIDSLPEIRDDSLEGFV